MKARTPSPAAPSIIPVRLLDQCIGSLADLQALQMLLTKIDRCCTAVQKGHSLAEVLTDPDNLASLARAFGSPQNLLFGMQTIGRLALAQHSEKSFSITQTIDAPKKLDFLKRTFSGWAQFDCVFMVQFMENRDLTRIAWINPATATHWSDVGVLPAGTLITAYVKSKAQRGGAAQTQEQLALERIEAAFEVVQHQENLPAAVSAPAQPARTAPAKPTAFKRPAPTGARKPAPKPAPRAGNPFGKSMGGPSQPLSHSMQIVINKMDTFVHAGNAHLIISHARDYGGRIQIFVLRGEKHKVNFDADSIWSAEIRNGETMLFEFYGPKPDEAFLKELAKRTNKYTQMDKVANE